MPTVALLPDARSSDTAAGSGPGIHAHSLSAVNIPPPSAEAVIKVVSIAARR